MEQRCVSLGKQCFPLNTGKSSGEFGLCAEQLTAAGEVILPVLFDTSHEILRSSDVPACFNDGILTLFQKVVTVLIDGQLLRYNSDINHCKLFEELTATKIFRAC